MLIPIQDGDYKINPDLISDLEVVTDDAGTVLSLEVTMASGSTFTVDTPAEIQAILDYHA